MLKAKNGGVNNELKKGSDGNVKIILIVILLLNMLVILLQQHVIKILENKLHQAYNEAIKEINKNRNGE